MKSEFLHILEQRGFIYQCSDLESLDDKLSQGPQTAYIGFDATAQSLHIGNLTGIMMLYWFQRCGHRPITLLGGATSRVGDPSFKDEQRVLLDDETINTNIRHIQNTSLKQFLSYDKGKNAALMVNNVDWLDSLFYLEFLRDYGRHFTVNRMLSFDSVKQRLERESPLSFLELNYMIMQAYDFLELHRRYDTILQMGGSDQWGNIINGVDLGHKARRIKLFGLTSPLLTTPDGRKMGKTESGAVWLNSDMLSPYEYYQYWRNVEDSMTGVLLRRFTILPIEEIQRLEKLQGQEINEAKKILAFEATQMCHGTKAAQEAAETAHKTFDQGQAGSALPTLELPRRAFEDGVLFTEVTSHPDLALLPSKSEARRLIKQGGARVNDEVINDPEFCIDTSFLKPDGSVKLSAGKKKHAVLKAV